MENENDGQSWPISFPEKFCKVEMSYETGKLVKTIVNIEVTIKVTEI